MVRQSTSTMHLRKSPPVLQVLHPKISNVVQRQEVNDLGVLVMRLSSDTACLRAFHEVCLVAGVP